PGLAEWGGAAGCLGADAGSSDTNRETARQAIVIAETETAPHRLFELGGLKLRGERAATYEEARRAVEQAALDELAARDRDLLQELLDGFAAAYPAAKDGETALDFADPQLRARALLPD